MANQKALILQHSDDTPPGSILSWLTQKGLPFEVYRLDHEQVPPRPASTDLVFILGGPMSVYETAENPWLLTEIKWIKSALEAGCRVAGICLGSQLLAHVLGSKVYRNQHWEIGWHEVTLSSGETLKVFQWHQDTFDLPKGAERMAQNQATLNQGFRFGQYVWATQFHPEAENAWILESADYESMPSGPYVQPAREIKAGIAQAKVVQKWFFSELDQFFDFVTTGAFEVSAPRAQHAVTKPVDSPQATGTSQRRKVMK